MNNEDIKLTVLEGDCSKEEIDLNEEMNDYEESNENDLTDNKSKGKSFEEKADDNKNKTFDTVDDIVLYYKERYQSDTWKYLNWWKELPSKDRYKAGDLVYINTEKKFGVFLEPARKDNLIKVLNLKKDKAEIYTRPWYYELEEIQLVKRGNKIIKGFLQVDNRLYKLDI